MFERFIEVSEGVGNRRLQAAQWRCVEMQFVAVREHCELRVVGEGKG